VTPGYPAMDQRLVTWLGSDLIFGAVSLALLIHPSQGTAIYPAYGLLFLWSDFRKENESHVIFLFLVTMAGVVLGAVAHAGPAVVVEVLGLWLLSWAVGLHSQSESRAEAAAREEQAALEASIKDDERELQFYKKYRESVDAQIRIRRDLTEGAKSLGNTFDAREVHLRLSQILAARFPAARLTIAAGIADDPLLGLALRLQGPVMIKDSASDQRLAGARTAFRSAVAVPLKVMRRAAGFVKLESDKPGAFGAEDVRTIDLLATMASLSLENIQFYENVHEQATHDALTQLFSHKAFQNRLKEELLRAGRSQSPLSFILCDIDHFKRYNDQYGHQAGDQLLKTVAGILTSFARPVDFAARYGGEEFCLILPNFVRSEAVDLANRLRLRVASEAFVFKGERTSATMSLGVSSFPQDATTPSQIVRVADERLYRAKEGGRNQVVG
jgi:diguanylate cyclase (GGDEF)-like protein